MQFLVRIDGQGIVGQFQQIQQFLFRKIKQISSRFCCYEFVQIGFLFVFDHRLHLPRLFETVD